MCIEKENILTNLQTFPSHLPGFEIFRDDFNNHLIKDVIVKHLNKQICLYPIL